MLETVANTGRHGSVSEEKNRRGKGKGKWKKKHNIYRKDRKGMIRPFPISHFTTLIVSFNPRPVTCLYIPKASRIGQNGQRTTSTRMSGPWISNLYQARGFFLDVENLGNVHYRHEEQAELFFISLESNLADCELSVEIESEIRKTTVGPSQKLNYKLVELSRALLGPSQERSRSGKTILSPYRNWIWNGKKLWSA